MSKSVTEIVSTNDENSKELNELHNFNFLILYIAYYIHENYDNFIKMNDGKVLDMLENPNNNLCKMMRLNFPFLDDQWVYSMSASMLVLMFINISNK